MDLQQESHRVIYKKSFLFSGYVHVAYQIKGYETNNNMVALTQMLVPIVGSKGQFVFLF